MITWTSAAEDAASIRKALKAKGWTSRQISVRSDTYSMGSSIDVTIKAPGISKAAVEAIAKEFDHVRRDGSGEILSGGNRFVNVYFDETLREPGIALLTPWLAALPVSQYHAELTVGEFEFSVERRSEWEFRLFVDGSYVPSGDAGLVASIIARYAVEQEVESVLPATRTEALSAPVTTAQKRTKALEAEGMLQWQEASRLRDEAAANLCEEASFWAPEVLLFGDFYLRRFTRMLVDQWVSDQINRARRVPPGRGRIGGDRAQPFWSPELPEVIEVTPDGRWWKGSLGTYWTNNRFGHSPRHSSWRRFWHPELLEVRPVNFDQSAGIWYRILGSAGWAYMGCFWTGEQTPHVARHPVEVAWETSY